MGMCEGGRKRKKATFKMRETVYPELTVYSGFYRSMEMYQGLTVNLSLINAVLSLKCSAMLFICLLAKNKSLITTEYFCR